MRFSIVDGIPDKKIRITFTTCDSIPYENDYLEFEPNTYTEAELCENVLIIKAHKEKRIYPLGDVYSIRVSG